MNVEIRHIYLRHHLYTSSEQVIFHFRHTVIFKPPEYIFCSEFSKEREKAASSGEYKKNKAKQQMDEDMRVRIKN